MASVALVTLGLTLANHAKPGVRATSGFFVDSSDIQNGLVAETV